jgi:hypothetical protein
MDSGMDIPSQCELTLTEKIPEYTVKQKIGIVRQFMSCLVNIFNH